MLLTLCEIFVVYHTQATPPETVFSTDTDSLGPNRHTHVYGLISPIAVKIQALAVRLWDLLFFPQPLYYKGISEDTQEMPQSHEAEHTERAHDVYTTSPQRRCNVV